MFIKGTDVRLKKTGFTIVELLTSLTIIAILVALLLPALKMVRNMAKETAQKSQFATIDMAIMAFKNDYGDYPPSSWIETSTGPLTDYSGIQMLTEALLGWDLLGFHPNSAWRSDGKEQTGTTLVYDASLDINLQQRRGPYLELATTNAFRLGISAAGKEDGLFQNPTSLASNTYVICDVFGVKRITLASGKTVKAGTPILYYKANTSFKNITDPQYDLRIYNAYDNDSLVSLGKVDNTAVSHPLGLSANPEKLYDYDNNGGIKDPKASTATRSWPCRPDSYILISAGADGLYGTGDDIHNF